MMASGGFGITQEGEVPSQPELTVAEMAAAVDAAHNAGLRTTAHADGVPGIRHALEAGIDCIEHGIFLGPDEARFMAQHDVALVPTLSTMQGIYEHGLEYSMPESWIPIARDILEPHRASFQAALDAGVLCATGTDGFGDIVDEMQLFTTFGLSSYRAIQAATLRVRQTLQCVDDKIVIKEPKTARSRRTRPSRTRWLRPYCAQGSPGVRPRAD